jgi:hypothetical protein
MKTIALGFLMFTGVVAGCSTLPRHAPRQVAGAELRGAAPVRAGRAKALVSGPALVRHLETDGAGVVTLYLSDDPGTGDRACPSARAENATPLAVLNGRSRLTDLLVPEGMRVCAAVSDAGAMRVSWHAQAADVATNGAFNVALLAR